jgi:hypothetical protein
MAADPSEGTAAHTTAEQVAADAERAAEGVNQGATGNRPLGESPLSVDSETDAYTEHPEAFVGAAFAGGLALALILRRVTR